MTFRVMSQRLVLSTHVLACGGRVWALEWFYPLTHIAVCRIQKVTLIPRAFRKVQPYITEWRSPGPHPHKGTDHVPKGAAEPNAVPTPGTWHSGLRQLLVTLDIPMLALNLGAPQSSFPSSGIAATSRHW